MTLQAVIARATFHFGISDSCFKGIVLPVTLQIFPGQHVAAVAVLSSWFKGQRVVVVLRTADGCILV